MTQPPSGSLPDPNAPDSSNMGGSFNTGNPYNPDYTNPSYSSPDASASAYPQGGQSFAAGQPFPASVQPVWTPGAPQGPKTSKRGPLIMLISGIVAMIILGPVLMVAPLMLSMFSPSEGTALNPINCSVNAGSRVRVPKPAVSAKALPPTDMPVTVPALSTPSTTSS